MKPKEKLRVGLGMYVGAYIPQTGKYKVKYSVYNVYPYEVAGYLLTWKTAHGMLHLCHKSIYA